MFKVICCIGVILIILILIWEFVFSEDVYVERYGIFIFILGGGIVNFIF